MSSSPTAIRLLISDVDGTLVDKHKQLTPATVDAVKRLEATGTGFTIISARPRSGMMPIAEALAIDSAMGAFNGGIVFKRDGSISQHHTIPADVARGIYALAEGAAVDRWVFTDDRWYASTDQGVHAAHEQVASNQAPIVTSDFTPQFGAADKITFVSDDAPLLADLLARMREAYGAQATIGQSQTYYLDITALQANKGAGIVALAAAFGVPLSEVAAIGDQYNDVAMLERAGLGIAMCNAPDGVKAIAAHVTRANDADGVAHAIDTYILPRIGA